MENLTTSSDFTILKLIRHLQENCQYKESMENILSNCEVLSSILRLTIPACQEKSVINIAKDLCRGEGIQVPEDIKELMNTTIDGLKSSYIDESIVCEKTVRIELSDQNSFLVNLGLQKPGDPFISTLVGFSDIFGEESNDNQNPEPVWTVQFIADGTGKPHIREGGWIFDNQPETGESLNTTLLFYIGAPEFETKEPVIEFLRALIY